MGFVDMLAKTSEEMPVPFGDAKCRLLPDDGLPKEDLLPRLSKTRRRLAEHMHALLDEMNAETFKLGNSTSLLSAMRVCTEYGVMPSEDYFVVGLNATVPEVIARGCDAKNASLR
ncbi:hypothetical protein AAVH_36403, partial [Aphelenchoides avenae]